jgi:AraC-like DNA-binding protein
MDYLTVKEAGNKWGLGSRRVTLYCVEGRINGVVKKGNLWLIPADAVKPEDRKRKKTSRQAARQPASDQDKDVPPVKAEQAKEQAINDGYEPDQPENPWPFQSLYENQALFVEIVKHFPHPMHICSPDGTMLLANEAYLEFAQISNPERLYKKHNILRNPNLERWGIKDFTVRAFQGEAMTAMPIRDIHDQLLYVVFIFITSRFYQDREEIVKGKEYLDDHWQEEFDPEKLAGIVNMSKYHYTRLFKQHTGMTPYNYYKEVKFNKLKEKLCDTNLSITQAFDECGVSYNGYLAKKFKEKLGMSPSQYRAMMTQN